MAKVGEYKWSEEDDTFYFVIGFDAVNDIKVKMYFNKQKEWVESIWMKENVKEDLFVSNLSLTKRLNFVQARLMELGINNEFTRRFCNGVKRYDVRVWEDRKDFINTYGNIKDVVIVLERKLREAVCARQQ